MLRWILLLCVVVVGLTAAATYVIQNVPDSDSSTRYAVNERTGPQPKVEIGQPLMHEFGTMSQETKATHSWKIKNVGEADLNLWLEGNTTCSCTVAKLQTKGEDGAVQRPVVTVKPGDSTNIDLEWNTKTMPVDYSQGATIGTNDASRPSFMITVKGKVYPPVSVFPPEMITLNGISNEEVTKAMIAVYSMDRPETKIKKLTTSRPGLIVATQMPMLESDRTQLKVKNGYRVEVEVRPGMPMGTFQDELLIETDHPIRPTVKVSIAGKTTGPISFLPERLRMTNVTSSRGGTQNLTLLVRGGKPTSFKVAHKPAKVDIAITPYDSKSQKGRYRLTATVPPGTSAGSIDEEITLETDNPKASILRIPVFILISDTDAG